MLRRLVMSGVSIFMVTIVPVSAQPVSAQPVSAIAPEKSLRPLIRHLVADQAMVTKVPTRPKSRPQAASGGAGTASPPLPVQRQRVRPVARPASEQTQGSAARLQSVAFLGPDVSTRPFARPASVLKEALFGRNKRRKGSVCGDIDIQGTEIGRVPAKLKGCGIKNGVKVTSVSGVRLSRPATMDCKTAQALNRWVKKGVKPAFRRGGPVVELRVAAGYACRTRNNKPGARISEHGRGKAIDISAFTMNDGKVVTVLDGWGKGRAGRALRKVWKSACGPFGTVLGPDADRYHRGHFHIDTASYRSGSYCK